MLLFTRHVTVDIYQEIILVTVQSNTFDLKDATTKIIK